MSTTGTLQSTKVAKHQNKTYKCPQRDKEFVYVQSLQMHVTVCYDGKVFTCVAHNKDSLLLWRWNMTKDESQELIRHSRLTVLLLCVM